MSFSPLVSILMPVYNSSDFVRSENRPLLPGALDSLLAQTYSKFELIILDNQSTDRTLEICKSYAARDSRIRVIVDSERRFVEDSINRLAGFMKGEFCFIANDDDLWDREFIQKMISVFQQHPDLDLVYPNGRYLDVSGKKLHKFVPSQSFAYTKEMARTSQVANYLHNRNIIPLAFGMFRAESFVANMPYKSFDELKANVDHLFIVELFLKGCRLSFLNEELFFYRTKSRRLDPRKVPGMPDIDRPQAIYWYYVRHQVHFLDQIISSIAANISDRSEQLFLCCSALDSFVLHSIDLLNWLIKDRYFKNFRDWLMAIRLRKFSRRILRPALMEASFFNSFEPNRLGIRTAPAQMGLMINKLDILFKAFFDFVILGLSGIKNESDLVILENLKVRISKYRELISQMKLEIASDQFSRPQIFKAKLSQKKATESPVVSIISPSKNLGRFLEETLVSVQAQTHEWFEHLVVDGASSDQSRAIAAKFPDIRWMSEPDTGYSDAFWKGFRLSRGRYIFQCAVSDGYLDESWVERCSDLLDREPEVSLVWGFPQTLSEDGRLLQISHPQFHYQSAPDGVLLFDYWLQTQFWLPEGNFCVRREVIASCFPALENISNVTEPWLEFNYQFHRQGYLARHLPIIANFGRQHHNQLGQRETESGVAKKKLSHYYQKCRRYRNLVLFGLLKHEFKDGRSNKIGCQRSVAYLWKTVISGIFHRMSRRWKRIFNAVGLLI